MRIGRSTPRASTAALALAIALGSPAAVAQGPAPKGPTTTVVSDGFDGTISSTVDSHGRLIEQSHADGTGRLLERIRIDYREGRIVRWEWRRWSDAGLLVDVPDVNLLEGRGALLEGEGAAQWSWDPDRRQVVVRKLSEEPKPPSPQEYVDRMNEAAEAARKSRLEAPPLPRAEVFKAPPAEIDPCLVGTWEAVEVETFAGFRVSFAYDGRQTVDYSAAKALDAGAERIVWRGVGTNRIATQQGVASVVESRPGTVTMTLHSAVVPDPVVWQMETRLGPGGLGTTTGDNRYLCTRTRTAEKGTTDLQGDLLEYRGSTHRDGQPNYAVKLRRVAR